MCEKVSFAMRVFWSCVVLIPILCQCGTLKQVPCDANYQPEDCDLPDLPLSSLRTVEDFERCAPAVLSKPSRNYFMLGSGREITLAENKEAFKRIRIFNRVLRDVSRSSTSTMVLGQRIGFPVGASPTGVHSLAHPGAENATAKGIASMDTVMILSSYATTSLEQVATAFRSGPQRAGHLWMQTYLFEDRKQTEDIVRRAERAGYRAIVATVDSPISPESRCNSRNIVDIQVLPNLFGSTSQIEGYSVTFKDLAWLCKFTKLPVVAKGILTGADAVRAVRAGASAIMVSNHGGRQLDSATATIDALPGVVAALRKDFPYVEVYIDGGVRNGVDVFKALLRGARAVFVGRPIVWGLAAGGEEGVRKVLTILKSEFNETMLIAGYSSSMDIQTEMDGTFTDGSNFSNNFQYFE